MRTRSKTVCSRPVQRRNNMLVDNQVKKNTVWPSRSSLPSRDQRNVLCVTSSHNAFLAFCAWRMSQEAFASAFSSSYSTCRGGVVVPPSREGDLDKCPLPMLQRTHNNVTSRSGILTLEQKKLIKHTFSFYWSHSQFNPNATRWTTKSKEEVPHSSNAALDSRRYRTVLSSQL